MPGCQLDWETSEGWLVRRASTNIGEMGRNRSESIDLATVSCSKPAVKVWMRWPPSGLCPRLGVRDFIDLRENRLSLGFVRALEAVQYCRGLGSN